MKKGMAILISFIMAVVVLPSTVHGADDGGFEVTETSRFFIASDEEPDKELKRVVKLFDSQFSAAGVPSEEQLMIVRDKRKRAKAGDIAIIVDPEYKTGLANSHAQGYTMTLADDGVLEITAGTNAGVQYALTDLLQRSLAGDPIRQTIQEAPQAKERTLLLDCGRKYYSKNWIENLIKRMSWQRYTSLHLHFSDNEGMGFESKLYPWLTMEESLSYEDLESICATARQYNIEIIPELDSPGHLGYIIAKYAEHAAADPSFTYEYESNTYDAYRTKTIGKAPKYEAIDLDNYAARAFVGSLIDEYADFFKSQGCTKFGIGGDELTFAGGTPSDTFIGYLNDLNRHLRKKGYTCRVWNDEIHRSSMQQVQLDKNIDIIYWSNSYAPVMDLVADGNRIHNSNTQWCYYVIREDSAGGDIMDRTRRFCNGQYIYENWNIRNCANPEQMESLIPEDSFAGGYLCIWADRPDYKISSQVWEETSMRTWANSAKLWDSDIDQKMAYNEFGIRVEKYGPFPGFCGNCDMESKLPLSNKIQGPMGLFDRIIQFFNK